MLGEAILELPREGESRMRLMSMLAMASFLGCAVLPQELLDGSTSERGTKVMPAEGEYGGPLLTGLGAEGWIECSVFHDGTTAYVSFSRPSVPEAAAIGDDGGFVTSSAQTSIAGRFEPSRRVEHIENDDGTTERTEHDSWMVSGSVVTVPSPTRPGEIRISSTSCSGGCEWWAVLERDGD